MGVEVAGGFPVDDATLILLAASLDPSNFEDDQSHFHDFLAMGEAEPIRKTLLTEDGLGGAPVYEVEYPEGQEPWSHSDVILALIAEIQRLRADTPGER